MAQLQGSSTRSTRKGMMTGLFRDRESAERAYESLRARGYGQDDVNVLMTDEARTRWFPSEGQATTELGSKALEGAGVGGAIGGTVGALLAVLAATATVAVPGIGLLAAGPIAAALAGAGAGGAAGTLIGALVGSGIPEDRAKVYEAGLKGGGIVMGVSPRSDEDATYLEREWRSSRGEHIYR